MIYSIHLREGECDGPSVGTLMRKYGLHGSGTLRVSGASLAPYSPIFKYPNCRSQGLTIKSDTTHPLRRKDH
jgi:hypothetical protein